MNLSAFKPFFSFQEPSWSPKVAYGFTHFYNQARSHIDWDSFSVIKKSTERCGEIALGQMPIYSSLEPLIKKLVNNGLVVSCNDNFELSGVGAMCSIIPPHIWSHYNIEHLHLPFSDFLSNADPLLIVQILQKMFEVHYNKGNIYIHCKAGRSRSALITALFLCITSDTVKQELLLSQNTDEIDAIVLNAVNQLKPLRPQVSVSKANLALGAQILKHYISYWKGTHDEPHLFNISDNIADKLTPEKMLGTIAQSNEYKFVWDQAYKNFDFFPVLKLFSERIYDYVEKNRNDDFDMDQIIGDVLSGMDKDDANVVTNLHIFYLANRRFINEIKRYPDFVQNLGLKLLDKIIKSKLSYTEKTAWLEKTRVYLNKPGKEQLNQYNNEIQAALIHSSLTLQLIGGFMIALGAAVILVSLVAGFLASGSLLGVSLAILGAGAFGAFEIAIGAMVYGHGTSDAVAKASESLVHAITDDLDMAPKM